MTEYSEDELIEQSAIGVFKRDLKYEHLNCYEEKFPDTLGRELKSDVVLVNRLLAAMEKLNDNLSEDAKKEAIAQLLQDRSRLSLVKANQEVYKLIKDGVKVKIKKKKGGYEYRTVKIIDFNTPENNDFFLASQFWVTGDVYTRRPDLVCFVNGLPLVVIEFKSRKVDIKKAFDDNISDYKDTIPKLFWYNAFIIISNGRDAKIGSLTSGYEYFSDWKKIRNEKEVGIISLDTILKGTCEANRILDILENFILFTTIEGKNVKIIAKNHQYLGVNNAIEAFEHRTENNGRIGVFWHTQGAGKSFSMIFFTQKILRKFEGNFTFLIVTDRRELDDQIYENFQHAGVVTEEEVQAKDGKHLKLLLKEDHRLIFTLIHKFGTKKGETYPKLSDRDDIIVITDEAHRTQYDILALNMRNALPNASFIGFTGTPLIAGEEKTKETFGDYVSIYNFRSSIDDQATVPLFYENRVPELNIINPELNDDIYDTIEEADLNEEQEEKLSRQLSREYHVITRDDRLNIVAEDIVNHFVNRGYGGKAMVISIDKFTAVKMFDKVQYFWKKYIDNLEAKLKKAKGEEVKEIKAKIEELKKVDMAVVVSQGQNEVRKFKKEGLDITKHRKRMVREDLVEEFKDPDNNFKIVFVCSMWMTGFDVPSLSTIYLDKPMRNHTLMQAIARANRVFEEKPAGFIVDYINVFRNLKKALAIYATPVSGGQVDLPIQAKDKLVQALREYVKGLDSFLSQQHVESKNIISSRGLEKNALLDQAVSSLVTKDDIKNNFIMKARHVIKIYRAILPHKDATEFTAHVFLYQELVKEIYSLDPEIDISEVIKSIQTVLDKSIISKGYIEQSIKNKNIDLSKIDFGALKKQFEKKKSNTDIERLKNIISFKIREMIKLNITRVDFQEKFQKLVDEYNLGSLNQEMFFNELIKFSNNLNEESRRKIVEGLTEEELALFDKLKKKDLSERDKNKVKKVSKELLQKLKDNGLKAVDWRKKQQTRALVKREIEIELDKGLPKCYNPEDYKNKCDVAFQHFFDNYYGESQSVFSGAG